jgi:hypothetical protein
VVTENQAAGGVRDQTGPEPAGTRWVHAEPAGSGAQGHERSPCGLRNRRSDRQRCRHQQLFKRRARVRVSPPGCREPSGPLPTRRLSPRTGLTLRSSMSRRRQVRASSSSAAVPPACHKQRSIAVSSGQSRSHRGGRCAGRTLLTWGGRGARNCMACKGQRNSKSFRALHKTRHQVLQEQANHHSDCLARLPCRVIDLQPACNREVALDVSTTWTAINRPRGGSACRSNHQTGPRKAGDHRQKGHQYRRRAGDRPSSLQGSRPASSSRVGDRHQRDHPRHSRRPGSGGGAGNLPSAVSV